MKSNFFRNVSLFLVLALTLSLFPVVALAANGDLTDVSINGVTVSAVTGGSDLSEAEDAAMTVVMTDEDAAKTNAAIAGTVEGGASYSIYWCKFDSASAEDIEDESGIFDGTEYTQGALDDGDVVWAVILLNGEDIVQIYKFNISIQQGADGTITGDSTVENPILSVVLPQKLDFAIDPLQLTLESGDTSDTQLKSANFVVVNKTNAPVHIGFTLTATGKTGVTFTDDKSTLERDNVNKKTKEVYFAALGAKELRIGSTIDHTTAITSALKFDYDVTSAALVPFAADDDEATGKIEFALGAATRSGGAVTALADNDQGYAAFKFYAQLNTYAPWQTSDITISGAYTLTALRTNTYTNMTKIEDSLNQVDSRTTIDAQGTISGAKIAVATTGTAVATDVKGDLASDANFVVTSALWSGYEAGTATDWEVGETPILTITLTADSGYTFTGTTAFTELTVLDVFTDASAGSAVLTNNGRTLIIELTFTNIT